MTGSLLRFDGTITGLGTSAGVRLVVGVWPQSPFGPMADVMIEHADGHRVLLAPSAQIAAFVAGTYDFDEVRVEPVAVHVRPGPDGELVTVGSDSLSLRLQTAGRTPVGRLLAAVPRRLARARWWARCVGPAARLARPGVRTVGSAGQGRREWYCALDEHRVVAATVRLDGVELGQLRPVTPPVRFGFASTPPAPATVRVTTWIRTP